MANTNETRPDAPRPNRKRKKRRSSAGGVLATTGKVLGTLLLVGVTTGAILACFAAVYIRTVIVPKAGVNFGDFSLDLSTTMYYTDKQTGTPQELRTIYGGTNRVWIGYDELPQNLIDATIAIEDKRFMEHQGVDWKRTAAGVVAMFTGGDIQGGSTITQQLIKNLTNEDEVTVQRKILEIFRALEFEKRYKKEMILEWYLNYIYLGAHSDGVYTASYAYFDKHVSQLSLAECASLISITNNPSVFGPYAVGKDDDGNPDPAWGRKNNAKRAKDVINEMLKQGKITKEEADEAWAQLDAGLNFVRGEGEKHEETSYTWYQDQVISEVVRDLSENLGITEKAAERMVYYGGLEIQTCFDPKVQAVVDSVYEDISNLPYISGSGQQLQSGIVIVDPEGNVVALSGGMGEKEGNRLFSRATTRRAPGSAFKPLSVYAPAIDMGLITPGSVLDDIPYSINPDGSAYPSNSYGYYKGRMTVREAVYLSSNPVAIRALMLLTPEASFDFMTTKLGMQLVRLRGDKSDIGISPLAMGGLTDGVSAMEMAASFSVFPRGGTYLAPRTYTIVRDANGEVLLDNTTDRAPVQVMKSTTAWYMNDLLKGVINGSNPGATGTEANFKGMEIAGKTGSTNSNRDRWFVGYTPYYTAAVWTGYDQQERIKAKGNPAAQLWNKVMSRVHEGLEYKDFDKPEGAGEAVAVSVCADSGMLAAPGCTEDPRGSRVRKDYYFSGDAPTQYCTVHGTTVEICKDSVTEEGGSYHLAGEFCPEESRVKAAYLDIERDPALSVQARDNAYLKSSLDALGPCTVHTTAPAPEPYDPALFDISDEATWPTQDQWPGFDPTRPETWPYTTVVPPTTEPEEPGNGGNPGTDHNTPPPTGPDENQPFVPAA